MARALAMQPDLLVLDEFTANLDGPNVSTLEKLVKGHLNRGGGVVMATHNPFQAERLAKGSIVLDGGCVVASDSEISQAVLSGSWLG
jgi:tungstate transport system ATP-binding protein